jgi:hypothetical protein
MNIVFTQDNDPAYHLERKRGILIRGNDSRVSLTRGEE